MSSSPLHTDERFANERSDLRPLRSLLEEYRAHSVPAKSALRSVHHFACSGGTLICRALASQPNVLLLSEVNPLSLYSVGQVRYAPTDLITQAQAGFRRPDDKTVEEMFLASLSALFEGVTPQGMRVVVRDHSHSHFCSSVAYDSRPTHHAILARRFPLLSIVTVRHPLDSYLSLLNRGWVQFTPGTLEEYARRYAAFLDAHESLRLYRYEAFVASPDETVRQMASDLDLAYDARWQEALPAIRLTGDSGRSGDTIAQRPRRAIPEEVAAEARKSTAYQELCARLNYDAAPESPIG